MLKILLIKTAILASLGFAVALLTAPLNFIYTKHKVLAMSVLAFLVLIASLGYLPNNVNSFFGGV
jgi:hypothetical protein